jgi:hypothetical protein
LVCSLTICVLSNFCEGGAPQTPQTEPFYPFEVPKGKYPCDWPGLKNESDPASRWGGNDFQHLRATAPTYRNWPGLGYVAWIGLADKTKGDQVVFSMMLMILLCHLNPFLAQGGNLWAIKLGELPCDYTYAPSTPISISQFDKIQVFVQDGFELVKFKDGDAYSSCNMQQAEPVASPVLASLPTRVSDAFVEQAAYPCRKASDGVLNPWSCETISSAAKDVEHNPLNPNGLYTAKFPKAVTITLTPADAGKTLYFADKTRCLTTKFQATVSVGRILIVPWTEHTERFQYKSWLQNAYDLGLSIGANDEVWFTTATYEHNIYRVNDKSKWTGVCTALGGLTVAPADAVLLDVDQERFLFYPSNSPNARHLWKLEARKVLPNAADEAYLGCYNVFHECCCGPNNTFLGKLPCAVTHCNMGSAGGQRILVRRAAAGGSSSAASSTPSSAASAAALALMAAAAASTRLGMAAMA